MILNHRKLGNEYQFLTLIKNEPPYTAKYQPTLDFKEKMELLVVHALIILGRMVYIQCFKNDVKIDNVFTRMSIGGSGQMFNKH